MLLLSNAKLESIFDTRVAEFHGKQRLCQTKLRCQQKFRDPFVCKHLNHFAELRVNLPNPRTINLGINRENNDFTIGYFYYETKARIQCSFWTRKCPAVCENNAASRNATSVEISRSIGLKASEVFSRKSNANVAHL